MVLINLGTNRMKRLFRINLAVIGILAVIAGWQLWQNNRPVDFPTRAQLDTALDAVAGWLESRQEALIHVENPILFWMIRQAHENTGHEKIGRFYQAYKTQKLDTQPPNLWTPYFDESYRPRVPPLDRLENFHDYQLMFAYSISCDSFMADEPVILAQLEPGFCRHHFLHPRCVTHQVMGLRFMQRYRCGSDDKVESTLSALQDTMYNEMRWDFRVGDAYIQRVSMLTDSGAGDHVKPVWIRRILEAQNPDGSWDDFHPFIPLPGDRTFGFTSTLPEIRTEVTGNFHTTAQAVWLLSMLIRNHIWLAPDALGENGE